MHGGHAQAVAEAIEFPSGVVLPEAIAHDHKLQAEGHQRVREVMGQRLADCKRYVDEVQKGLK